MFSGQRRTAIAAGATFAACTMVATLLLPDDSAQFWHSKILDVHRIGDPAALGNQSLSGALARWGMPETWRRSAALVLGLGVAAAAIVRATRAWRAGHPLAAAVIVGAAGIVLSPVSWTHHQVWLTLAASIKVRGAGFSVAWACLVSAIMILPVTSMGSAVTGSGALENSRLILAAAIAVLVPFTACQRKETSPRMSVEP